MHLYDAFVLKKCALIHLQTSKQKWCNIQDDKITEEIFFLFVRFMCLGEEIWVAYMTPVFMRAPIFARPRSFLAIMCGILV